MHRFLLAIMGPAQVGSLSTPVRPSVPSVEVCRRCGRPQTAHVVERDGDRSRSRCPTDVDGDVNSDSDSDKF